MGDTECASGFVGFSQEESNVTSETSRATEEAVSEVTWEQDTETRRRLPPVQCHNRNGDPFTCAGGDSCCGDVCVGMGDVCCVNVNGNTFPCQGDGGGCCGNACYAPGSKCCRSLFKPRSQWYPVTKDTECASGFVGFSQEESNLTSETSRATEEVVSEVMSDVNSETRRRLPPVHCRNRNGDSFTCAGGDSCCGDVCVARGDTCCVNVNGNTFPCQGDGGGCCGNACFAPGSKCCRSLFKP